MSCYPRRARGSGTVYVERCYLSAATNTPSDNITLAILWFVLIINIHPFLLQRYNRIRIYRTLNQKLS